MSTDIDNIIYRAEAGYQWANDGPILYEALKLAAQEVTSSYGKTVRLHQYIKDGMKKFETKRLESDSHVDDIIT